MTEKACPDPGRPERGYRFGHLTVGRTMRFFCQSGFKLHGSKERICLENKEWSGSLTTCQNGSMCSFLLTLATFVSNSGVIWCHSLSYVVLVTEVFFFLFIVLKRNCWIYWCSIFKVISDIRTEKFADNHLYLVYLSRKSLRTLMCVKIFNPRKKAILRANLRAFNLRFPISCAAIFFREILRTGLPHVDARRDRELLSISWTWFNVFASVCVYSPFQPMAFLDFFMWHGSCMWTPFWIKAPWKWENIQT